MCFANYFSALTLLSCNLPLSSPSTNSRQLLSQFSACSGWRWLDVGEKIIKIAMYWWTTFMEIFILKPQVVGKLNLFFRDIKWCFNALWGLKGLRVDTLSIMLCNTDRDRVKQCIWCHSSPTSSLFYFTFLSINWTWFLVHFEIYTFWLLGDWLVQCTCLRCFFIIFLQSNFRDVQSSKSI